MQILAFQLSIFRCSRNINRKRPLSSVNFRRIRPSLKNFAHYKILRAQSVQNINSSLVLKFLPGAVITARNFRHPVSIARKIMDESPHCALSGDGAMEFARSLDSFHEICAPEELKGNDCPHQQIHVPSLLKFAEFTDLIYTGYPIHKGQEQQENDTVGAVALDCNGYLACGNSSGMYMHM